MPIPVGLPTASPAVSSIVRDRLPEDRTLPIDGQWPRAVSGQTFAVHGPAHAAIRASDIVVGIA